MGRTSSPHRHHPWGPPRWYTHRTPPGCPQEEPDEQPQRQSTTQHTDKQTAVRAAFGAPPLAVWVYGGMQTRPGHRCGMAGCGGAWKNQLMAGQSTTTTREPAAVWRSPPPLAVWAGTWGGRSGHMRHPAAVAKTPTGGAERAATAPKHSAKARHNTQNNRRQCVRAASSYCAEKTTAGPARAVGCPGPIYWASGDCHPKPLRLDARNHQDSPLWGGRGRGAGKAARS